MINLETKIKLPFLWGKTVFKKSNWSQINLIVGPNGSGKTLLALELAKKFEQNGYVTKFIKADRNYLDQIHVLYDKPEIREKIEKILSNMFGKTISCLLYTSDAADESLPV